METEWRTNTLKSKQLSRVLESNSSCLKVRIKRVGGETRTPGPTNVIKMKMLLHGEISVLLVSSIHSRRPAAAE